MAAYDNYSSGAGVICDRCSACDHSYRIVQPTGPIPAQVMAIGEKPGCEEAYKGMVFVGDSGRELDRVYLPLAGLRREQVYVSNAVKCWLGGNNDRPTDAQITACSQHHLADEIRMVRPQLIVLLGATACSLLPQTAATGERLDLAKDHGIPFEYQGEWPDSVFGGWHGWIWPSYHPAAAMHDTGQMRFLLDDFAKLRLWAKGEWEPAYLTRQQTAKPDYRELETTNDFLTATQGLVYKLHVPVDTEDDGPQRPWSLQFSPRPHTGYLVAAHNTRLVGMFGEWLRSVGGIMAHSANHDLSTLERMEVAVGGLQIRDTMQEAYHLGNLPQGLKALGWRLLGVRMVSWEDTVLPASRDRLVEWMQAAYVGLLADEHQVRVETQLKTKVRVDFKPHALSGVLKRTLDYTIGHWTQEKWEGSVRLGTKRLVEPSRWVEPNPEYDPWERMWDKQVAANLPPDVREDVGLMPIVSIANMDRQAAIDYACQDADLTGQVGTVLEGLRRDIVKTKWQVDKEDWDQ